MTKVPSKQHITDLAELLKQQQVRHIIICPGSRNAPLIQAFQRDNHFHCFSIVDERSAAYVALGIAKETDRPAVVVTTSGTAVLNLAPAVAEAFNQKIPLIILTGDRPAEFPPQFTNQRINQAEVFGPNSRGYYAFPPEFENREALEKCMLNATAVLRTGCYDQPGPVHLNFLLYEPLYDDLPHKVMTRMPVITGKDTPGIPGISAQDVAVAVEYLEGQKKVLILAGMAAYGKSVQTGLEKICAGYQVAVIAENLANLRGPAVITSPEIVLSAAPNITYPALKPDLVIALGGPIVSKKTRLFVQGPGHVLSLVPEGNPESLIQMILHELSDESQQKNTYATLWTDMEQKTSEKASAYLQSAPFSNLSAMHLIMKQVPGNTTVHLGNSGVVRYSQLLPAREDLFYLGNRGTSGIDGSLSTAVGAAMVSENLHLAILGDLSFMYDSNALWNSNFPPNLKIIVINDKGGGIFRLLDGPDRMPFFKEFSVTHHPVEMEYIVRAFGMNILRANNDTTLEAGLDALFTPGSDTSVLEVNTSGSENSSIFKNFFKSIQNQ